MPSADSALVRVKDYIPDVFVDLKYATEHNFTGHRVYDFSDAYLRHGTVQKLKKAQEELRKSGLSLKIWDAYRPEAARNVQLVEDLLVACGFRAYEGEWWHYVDLDVYPVEEKL